MISSMHTRPPAPVARPQTQPRRQANAPKHEDGQIAQRRDRTCPSRIRSQAATGSWTSRQWETQGTLFSSARATMCPLAKVNGVWPFNDAWPRTSL